jgi:hypothetical protein
MNALTHILRRAAFRDLANRSLHRVAWGLLLGASAAVVLLVVRRTTGILVPDMAFVVLPALGAIIGLASTVASRRSRLQLAVRLDHELALKDRLGTSQALPTLPAPSEESSAFAELVHLDAKRIAEGLDIRRATPIRMTRVWWAAGGLTIGLWLAALYLPTVRLFDRDAPQPVAMAEQAAVQEQAAHVAQVVQDSVKQLPRDASQDARVQEELAAIDRLAEQLKNARSPDEVNRIREESAARMNDVADRLAEQADRDLAAAREVASRFAGVEASGAPKAPMSAEEFSNALRHGDLARAAEELERMLATSDQLPERDREALADALRRTSDQLRESTKPDDPQADERREQMAQALADQGLDEDSIRQWLEPTSPAEPSSPEESAAPPEASATPPEESPRSADDLERSLREQGVDEEIARKLARDVEELNRQRREQNQAQRDIDEMSRSLEQTADEVDRRSEETNSQAAPQGEASASQPEPSSSDPRRDPDSAAPQASRTPTDSPESAPQAGESTQKEDRPDDPSQPQSQPSAEPGAQPSPATQPDLPRQSSQEPQQPQAREKEGAEQGQPQSQAQSSEDATSQPQPSSQAQRQERPNEGQPQSDEAISPQPDGTAQRQEISESAQERDPQASPDQKREGDQSAPDEGLPDQQLPQNVPAPTPEAVKALRELAERQSTAEQQKHFSERLRETARELARNMTPEQREQWARQWQREMGQPTPQGVPDQTIDEARAQSSDSDGSSTSGEPSASSERAAADSELSEATTEDVDLRDRDVGDKVIAQWLDDANLDAAPEGGAATSSGAQRIIQAQNAAERAVNDAALPPRYHRFIKRVFGRLNETTREAAKGTAAPAAATSGGSGTESRP